MKPIIDLHSHYIPGPEAEKNFRALLDSPEIFRVAVCALDLKLDYCAAYPYMSRFQTTNDQLADFVAKLNSSKLVLWCFIDPLEKDVSKRLAYWVQERGMKGLKMYPPAGWYPDDERVLPVFQQAALLGIPVLLHMGRVCPHPS